MQRQTYKKSENNIFHSSYVYQKTKKNNRQISELRKYVRHVLYETNGLITEWDLALAYARSSSLLSEAQNNRGRLLMESLVSGIAKAFNWAGQKVDAGVQVLKKAGKEAIDIAGKIFTDILSQMKNGKSIFEMLKDFTVEGVEKISELLGQAVKEFSAFLTDKKERIMEVIVSYAGKDSSIMEKLKKVYEDTKKLVAENPKLQEKLEMFKKLYELLKTNPAAAVVHIVKTFAKSDAFRPMLGSILSMMAESALKIDKVKNSIVEVFEKAGFLKSKLGMFMLRILSFFTQNMGSEDMIMAAVKMWEAGSKVINNRTDLEYRKDALVQILPKIVYGIVSGDSSIEIITRVAATSGKDTSALQKLIKKGIALVCNTIKTIAHKQLQKKLKEKNLDPDSAIGKAVIGGVFGLLNIENTLTDRAEGLTGISLG